MVSSINFSSVFPYSVTTSYHSELSLLLVVNEIKYQGETFVGVVLLLVKLCISSL